MIKKTLASLVSIVLVLGVTWYFMFALKDAPISEQALVSLFQYTAPQNIELNMEQVAPRQFKISFTSFDGSQVEGRLSLPEQEAESYPLLIGLHAMGRSYPRWWVEAIKGRPTVTQVNDIAAFANQQGYAVIALDARYHGTRKDPELGLKKIMMDMHLWGEKKPYESMVRNTVIDYRVLLDWVEKQAMFNQDHIMVAGYSMGGQMSLLLGSLDSRVDHLVAIVPPYLDDKTASVAPKNIVHRLKHSSVLLVTGNDDENASVEQNAEIFNQIASQEKVHKSFEAGHILPENYVEVVFNWIKERKSDSSRITVNHR